MSYALAMLKAHPRRWLIDAIVLEEMIQASLDCAQACTACADACLAEPGVEALRRCVRGSLDCADVCEVTGRLLSRHTTPDLDLVRALLWACAAACKACRAECQRHAEHHLHCRICAEACRRCEEACNRLLAALPA